MIPQTRKLFSVVVHYDRPEDTKKLISSITSAQSAPDKTVIVDHSPTSSFVFSHPRVEVVYPGINGGYAAGLMYGMSVLVAEGATENDIVVGMNNDVLLSPTTFLTVRSELKNNDKDLVIGAKIGRVNLFTGRARLIRNTKTAAIYEMSYIHGSFIGAQVKTWSQVPWPAKYFMYWEDVAWSRQLARQKILWRAIPDLKIGHDDSETSGSKSKTYYLVRNGAVVLENQSPFLWRWYWLLINRLRYAYHLVVGHRLVAKALRDARQGKTGRVEL